MGLPMEPTNLKARRAIVSGASRGIGAAIASALARDGCRVVIGFRTQQSAALAVAASIHETGGDATIIQFDVADRDSVSSALQALDHAHDPFDIVINNAAVLRDAIFPAMQR